MKKTILFFILSFLLTNLAAQTTKVKLYNPEANAKLDIKMAVTKAKAEGKHVLLQIGGNWCVWCIAFNKKVIENDTLNKALKSKYITYHLNYSKENWNEDVLADLGYPQRFGFPVFVVLDGNGKRLHTQNSGFLEESKSYNTNKVLEFFNHWSTVALDSKNYPSKNRSN